MKWWFGQPLTDESYCRRWSLLPRNNLFNVYLHHFVGPDTDRHMHDHPWNFVSVILYGWYREAVGWPWSYVIRHRVLLNAKRATDAHTIIEVAERGCWTLVLHGPRYRPWGFWTRDGWRPFIQSSE